jgi:hypothetical protein
LESEHMEGKRGGHGEDIWLVKKSIFMSLAIIYRKQDLC